MTTRAFYDELAEYYDLIYPNWEASIMRQATHLSALIAASGIGTAHTILDVSCGIGTQALGLAKLGYRVTASDLSEGEVHRARREANARGLEIDLSVCDMRRVADHHAKGFDVVLSADNSLPHLLSDEEIVGALRQFHLCLRPGGLCVVTLRDYEKEDLKGGVIRPYAVRERDGARTMLYQVWKVEGAHYETSMYMVTDTFDGGCTTRVSRSRYYAIPIPRLMELMAEAGFANVTRKDGVFFQPVITGVRVR